MEIYKPTLAEVLDGRDLTDAEERLLACCKTGEPAFFGYAVPDDPNPNNQIDAALIRFLLLGGDEAHVPHPMGVQIFGAYVVGALDFQGCQASVSLLLGCTRFTVAPNFERSQIISLTISGGSFPGFHAPEMNATQDVRFHGGADFEGAVILSGAIIEGGLYCSFCTFRSEEKHALNCKSIDVRQAIYLSEGISAFGGVNLRRAQVGKDLNLNHSTFDGEGRAALECEDMCVGSDLHIRHGFLAKGSVRLDRTIVKGRLVCENRDEYKFYLNQLKR